MASSAVYLCLCTLTFVLYISGSWSLPTRLYTDYDDAIDTESIISNAEYMILRNIEEELQQIKVRMYLPVSGEEINLCSTTGNFYWRRCLGRSSKYQK